jgi:hypothetical protein
MAVGLDQYQGLRTPPVFWPLIRFVQAQAHVEAGTPAAGFPLIDEALALAGSDGLLAPLFHIVRGDLALLGSASDVTAATAAYERAYAVSERVGSPMTQLRAAVRLARTAEGSARADRLEQLRAIEATFAEGRSTPDLLEAAQLLD